MLRKSLELASRALAVGAVAGVAYLGFALFRVRAFSRRSRDGVGPALGVTVLKPLHGLEAGLEENLASFCAQDYSDFQVIFCAVDPEDPAVAVARRVVERFPGVDAEVVVGSPADVLNPKIANALNGYKRARYGVVTLVDADMRVEREYLRVIAAAFADESVGAVTCLYGGVAAEQTLPAQLAALFVNDHFAPSVLVAQSVEPLAYCFGSTMAFRRSVLEKVGGFAALGRTIADDYALGALVTSAGSNVALAPYVVGNVMADATFGALWEREVRWARTIRAARPLSSTLAVITYGLPLAFLAWALRPRSGRRRLVLAGAVLLRAGLHVASRSAFSPEKPLQLHLVALRDTVALAVWAAGRWGGSARWHDRYVTVD